MTALSSEIECLGLDTGRIHDSPLHVVLLQLGEGSLFCLLRNRLDGLRAILRLRGAGDIGQSITLDA